MLSFQLYDSQSASATTSETTPVILFLHGLGMAGWCWDPVRNALPEFAALVPDLPGHGHSAEIPWVSLAETARQVGDVIDTLSHDREVHVVGHSLGAYTGWMLLSQRPDRFKSAVLSGFHIGEISMRPLLRCAYVLNGAMFAVPAVLRRFAHGLFDEDLAKRYIENGAVIRPRTIRRAGIQVVDFQSPTGFDAPDVPLLAMSGSKEPDAIRTTPARLADRNSHVQGNVLDGRDHLWPLAEPEEYAKRIRTFLKSDPG